MAEGYVVYGAAGTGSVPVEAALTLLGERYRAFYDVAPRLGEVVRAIDAEPRLAALWATRMPFKEGWEG